MRRFVLLALVIMFVCVPQPGVAMMAGEELYPFIDIPLGSTISQTEKVFRDQYDVPLRVEREDDDSILYVNTQGVLVYDLQCSVQLLFEKSEDNEATLSTGTILFYPTIQDEKEDSGSLKNTFSAGYDQFSSIYKEYAEDHTMTGIYVVRYPIRDAGGNVASQYESLEDVKASNIDDYTGECNLIQVVAFFKNISVQGMWSNADTGSMWVMIVEYADEQQRWLDSAAN